MGWLVVFVVAGVVIVIALQWYTMRDL